MFKAVVASLLLISPLCASAASSVDVSKVYGKIQFVDSYPDLKVQQVGTYADAPGKWQVVNFYPGVN